MHSVQYDRPHNVKILILDGTVRYLDFLLAPADDHCLWPNSAVQCSLSCTVYNVQYNAQCIVYNIRYNIQCIYFQYLVYSTLHNIHCTLYYSIYLFTV